MPQSRTLKAATLGSGQFLVKVTTLVTAAILSRLFTQTDYAAYRQTLLAYYFVAPLLMLGLPQALYYFIPRDKEHARSILTGNLSLLLLMGLGFMVAMWCGGNELLAKRFSNPALSRLLLIFSPFAMLALPVTATGACLVSCNRVKTLTVYNVASRVVIFACIMGLVLIWRRPEAAISGVVVGELIVFLPAIVLMYRAAAGQDWRPSKENIWEQLKYSLPLGLAAMIGTISVSLDKIIVSSMCPPEEFAVYVNGAFEIPLIGVLTGSVMAVLVPEFVHMYKTGRHQELTGLWHRAMVKCSLFIMPLMVFLSLMAPAVLRILFSDKYVESVHPFRVYLLALPARITTFGTIFMAAGRNRLVVYRAATSLILNLVLSIILVSIMGSIGGAISTVVIMYLWVVPYNLFFISRILKKDILHVMPLGTLTKVFALSIGAGLVLLFAPLVRPLGDFLTLCILGPFYSAILLVFFVHFKFVDMKRMLATVRAMFSRR